MTLHLLCYGILIDSSEINKLFVDKAVIVFFEFHQRLLYTRAFVPLIVIKHDLSTRNKATAEIIQSALCSNICICIGMNDAELLIMLGKAIRKESDLVDYVVHVNDGFYQLEAGAELTIDVNEIGRASCRERVYSGV